MYKILLISANPFTKPYPVYPLGISYLSSYIKKHLDQSYIQLIDLNIQSFESLTKHLASEKPDYICVSLRNIDDVDSVNQKSFIDFYADVIELIKKNSSAKIIIGGSGFSIFPELLYEKFNVDFGIYGEGEESIVKLINCLGTNSDYSAIEGLLYKDKNGQIQFNKRINYLNNLELSFDDKLVEYYWKNSGMLNIQTKRGCPYNCIYCTYPLIEGKKVRSLNVDQVMSSIEELYHKYNINYIFFTDSVFNQFNNYNYELAEKLIKSGMKIKWGAYFSINNLSRDLLITLKKSGLQHIEFGTESFSDEVLEAYRKEFTVREILEKSEWCNELDINHAHFMILAGNGETKKTIQEAIENVAKIKRTVLFPYVGMRIYPGTDLQKIAIKENIITPNDNLLYPKYYIAKDFDLNAFKQKVNRRWIMPDEDSTAIMTRLKLKGKKGPLWEYLMH